MYKTTIWQGSYYELAIEFPTGGYDQPLINSLNAIWKLPFMEGPWTEEANFKGNPGIPKLLKKNDFNRLYGFLKLPDNKVFTCFTMVVREVNVDWLDFIIPVEMIESVYKVKYPLEKSNNPWMEVINKQLIEVAMSVYNVVNFDLALIGEEVSGSVSKSNITKEWLDKGEVCGENSMFADILISNSLYEELKPSKAHGTLEHGLKWYQL